MKRFLYILILIILTLAACSTEPSDSTVNTAIAKTQSAKPKNTTKPTDIPLPTATNTTEPTATATPKPTAINTPEPTATATNEYSDEQMIIVLEKTERLHVLPEDFEQPPAGEGNIYIVFKLTVTRIKGVHITDMFGSVDDRPTLLVDTDQEYEVSFCHFTGIQFRDLTDLRSGELTEGAEGFFAFEVPEESEPVRLTLIYSFKQDWEEETPVRGEIDIIL